MRVLYYDCFAGISGDMHLGAMIDAGVDPEHLINELKKLPLSGFHLHICRDERKSIEGTRVDVVLEGDHHHHHHHDHSHMHGHAGEHHHRNLKDIQNILSESTLPESTKARALKMFLLIAEAEAKIHGVSVDEIHFHEVGALDSIVDITGAAICLEYLKPDRIFCSSVELGSGMVHCAHGMMPVPAPATSEILKNIPVRTGTADHEATTPTGAAILAANVDEFTDTFRFTPHLSAYGIGQRDSNIPNILRIHIGEQEERSLQPEENRDDGHVCTMLECNIDDMNPEYYSHVMNRLFSEGARDVFITPVIMKESRPGVILSTLCDQKLQSAITQILFTETTTIGVRSYPVQREMMKREIRSITTSLGTIKVKYAWYQDRLIKWKPEFQDCKKLAENNQLSLQEVHRIVNLEINQKESNEN